jgi:hypothetical protein
MVRFGQTLKKNHIIPSSSSSESIVIIIIIIIIIIIMEKVVGLERGPLSLVSKTEELLDRKVAAPI